MFLRGSLTKRSLKLPPAQKQCWPFAALPVAEGGDGLPGWPRAAGKGTALSVLAQSWLLSSCHETLPPGSCPGLAFPLAQVKLTSGLPLGPPRAPMLPSVRAPFLLQLLPHWTLETRSARFYSLFLSSFPRAARHKEVGSRISPGAHGDIYPEQASWPVAAISGQREQTEIASVNSSVGANAGLINPQLGFLLWLRRSSAWDLRLFI